MPLSPLATAIYSVLRTRAGSKHPTVSYLDLVRLLATQGNPVPDLNPQDPRLNEALAELALACKSANPPLPPLAALVISSELNMPGSGYFKLLHPKARNEMAQLEAWGKDVNAVRAAAYPPAL